jgi:ribosomal protein S1
MRCRISKCGIRERSVIAMLAIWALGMGAAFVASVPAGPAQQTSPDKPVAQEEDKRQKRKPVHGKVEAVDPTAQTITVDGKVIQISSQTRLTKAGQTITVAQVKIGEDVQGTTRETLDGKTEALTLKVGPMDERERR